MIYAGGLDLHLEVEDVPKARGLAVVLPGFLDSIGYRSSERLAAALAAAGFTTVRLDLRGSWRNGGDPADYRTSVHVADVRSIVDRVRDSRIVVAGYCYGASIAAIAASVDDRISDVVALMPTRHFVWPDGCEIDPERWPDAGDQEFRRKHPVTGERVSFRLPHSVVDDARRNDHFEAFSRVCCRALFVAGERDRLAAPNRVRALHDNCSSPDKTFVVLGVGHDYRLDEAAVDIVNGTVVEWLG